MLSNNRCLTLCIADISKRGSEGHKSHIGALTLLIIILARE